MRRLSSYSPLQRTHLCDVSRYSSICYECLSGRVHHGLSSLCRVLPCQAPLVNCSPWGLLFTSKHPFVPKADVDLQGDFPADHRPMLDVLDDRTFEHPIVLARKSPQSSAWDTKRRFLNAKRMDMSADASCACNHKSLLHFIINALLWHDWVIRVGEGSSTFPAFLSLLEYRLDYPVPVHARRSIYVDRIIFSNR